MKTAGIEKKLLLDSGAVSQLYKRGDEIFNEGGIATHFYQIETGLVKMFNINYEGKEFVQGLFSDGESFGEPPLFIDKPYPSTATAIQPSRILKLERQLFAKLIETNSEVCSEIIYILASRTYSKAITTRDIVNNSPDRRILAFLEDYKLKAGGSVDRILIPFTRQMMANLTGLRVETVIRTLSTLNEMGKVAIVERKLYF